MTYAVLMNRVFQENPTFFLQFEDIIWKMLNNPDWSTFQIGLLIIRELSQTNIVTPNILSTIYETKLKIQAGYTVERYVPQ